MDLVTNSLLNTYKEEQSLPDELDQATIFEHFANYCVVASEYTDDFDYQDIHVAGGNDLQLDGIALIINGVLVNSTEEIDDLVNANKYLNAEIICVQAKSGKGFDGSEISNMFFGIRELSSEDPKLPRNEALSNKENIIRYVYSKSASFKHGNPSLKLYFVTTGSWQDDSKLLSRIENEISTLEDLIIFQNPEFIPIDARKLQKLYNRSKNSLTKTINFNSKVTLPAMNGVREAYLGYISVLDYIKMITDDNENLLRGLFYDNVRDFQGDNPVNKEIESTLKNDVRGNFVLLNNGVTVVSEDLKITGPLFTLKSFQIVNGCQTSHVIFNNKQYVNENVFISLKLIVAPEGELKNQVIKATNRQTVVKIEELSALTDFQKLLEEYYNAIPISYKLYYERRSQQFSSTVAMEKIRIVTIPVQIRSFASMFLGRAHQASRYYGNLLSDVEGKIFVEGHSLLAYYVSSFAIFRIESLIRKKSIDSRLRPFRYHILGIIRLLIAGEEMPSMTSNQFNKYCEKLKIALWDDRVSFEQIIKACALLETVLGGDYNRDLAKDLTIENKAKALIKNFAIGPSSLTA